MPCRKGAPRELPGLGRPKAPRSGPGRAAPPRRRPARHGRAILRQSSPVKDCGAGNQRTSARSSGSVVAGSRSVLRTPRRGHRAAPREERQRRPSLRTRDPHHGNSRATGCRMPMRRRLSPWGHSGAGDPLGADRGSIPRLGTGRGYRADVTGGEPAQRSETREPPEPIRLGPSADPPSPGPGKDKAPGLAGPALVVPSSGVHRLEEGRIAFRRFAELAEQELDAVDRAHRVEDAPEHIHLLEDLGRDQEFFLAGAGAG